MPRCRWPALGLCRPRADGGGATIADREGGVKSLGPGVLHHRRPSHLWIFFMTGENLGVDLFGDPVLPRQEGRGRPEHCWSLEKSNKVLLAFARGLSQKDAAIAVGVSVPTLRKVYFSECSKRAAARLRMEMTQLARLNAMAEGGNVAAEKELMKQLDRMRARDQVRASAPEPTARPRKLGKKEAAQQAAEQVRGLYEAAPPPGQMN